MTCATSDCRAFGEAQACVIVATFSLNIKRGLHTGTQISTFSNLARGLLNKTLHPGTAGALALNRKAHASGVVAGMTMAAGAPGSADRSPASVAAQAARALQAALDERASPAVLREQCAPDPCWILRLEQMRAPLHADNPHVPSSAQAVRSIIYVSHFFINI